MLNDAAINAMIDQQAIHRMEEEGGPVPGFAGEAASMAYTIEELVVAAILDDKQWTYRSPGGIQLIIHRKYGRNLSENDVLA